MRKIKLIWDFRGTAAARTAEHHAIHLKEFVEREQKSVEEIDFQSINELYAIAYMVVNEDEIPVYRDSLQPHRAVVA